jgi:hypothetical protein
VATALIWGFYAVRGLFLLLRHAVTSMLGRSKRAAAARQPAATPIPAPPAPRSVAREQAPTEPVVSVPPNAPSPQALSKPEPPPTPKIRPKVIKKSAAAAKSATTAKVPQEKRPPAPVTPVSRQSPKARDAAAPAKPKATKRPSATKKTARRRGKTPGVTGASSSAGNHTVEPNESSAVPAPVTRAPSSGAAATGSEPPDKTQSRPGQPPGNPVGGQAKKVSGRRGIRLKTLDGSTDDGLG